MYNIRHLSLYPILHKRHRRHNSYHHLPAVGIDRVVRRDAAPLRNYPDIVLRMVLIRRRKAGDYLPNRVQPVVVDVRPKDAEGSPVAVCWCLELFEFLILRRLDFALKLVAIDADIEQIIVPHSASFSLLFHVFVSFLQLYCQTLSTDG